MAQHHRSDTSGMRLYDKENRRLYINGSERLRFIVAAKRFPPMQRTLCLTLVYTGCRISEALELTPASVQLEPRKITFRTLKRRKPDVTREVPIPRTLAKHLNHDHQISRHAGSRRVLWQRDGKPLNRITAYRWVKEVMVEAEISGPQACPKGLRHGFAIHALLCLVQLHMVQKWMGHASIETTQIYADACGPEEQEIAERMWQGHPLEAIDDRSPLSVTDLRILASAYDRSVGNPPDPGEMLSDLSQRLHITSDTRFCFDNGRYFAVELKTPGFAVHLVIDRETQRVVSSADVTVPMRP